MSRFVYRPNHPQANSNGMVPVELTYSEQVTGSSVHIITDEMAPTRHMADGKLYTSKAKFRAATRAAGCVEVGNEIATVTKPRERIPLSRQERRDAIRRAIGQLRG